MESCNNMKNLSEKIRNIIEFLEKNCPHNLKTNWLTTSKLITNKNTFMLIAYANYLIQMVVNFIAFLI